jgi:hypothetical protein
LREYFKRSRRLRLRERTRGEAASQLESLSLDDGQLETLSDSLMTDFFTLRLMTCEAYSRVFGRGICTLPAGCTNQVKSDDRGRRATRSVREAASGLLLRLLLLLLLLLPLPPPPHSETSGLSQFSTGGRQ